MSDRLPGSSHSNPIQYRGWNIALCTCGASDVLGHSHQYEYAHEDYDGAPLESGGGAGDSRCGHASTVESAKREIDDYEEDHEAAGCGGIK